jgi:guanyl-specific ribonuclease Sa
MRDQVSPEAPVAVGAARELARHGTDLAAVCRDVATACQGYADQVDEHHAEIVSTCRELLAWSTVDQVTGAVVSFFTAGGAEVAAQLVESGVMARYAARVVAVLRRLIELAHAAAELIGRGLGMVVETLARLRTFLSLRTVRALERVGVGVAGRQALRRLPVEVQAQVEQAIDRAATGKVRFPRHDGKVFLNDDPAYRLPPGAYREWTVASAGTKRRLYRILVEGDPTAPNAIYFWDHIKPPVRIGP